MPLKRKFVLSFPNTSDRSDGYVLARALQQGKQAQVYLVRSFNGTPYVHKRFHPGEKTTEIDIYPFLPPHVAPAMVQHVANAQSGDSIVYDLCNGGDLENFIDTINTSEQGGDSLSGAVLWDFAKQIIELIAFIHHGWTPAASPDSKEQEEWHSIVHNDTHPGNILLHWPDDEPYLNFPRLVLADWGLAQRKTRNTRRKEDLIFNELKRVESLIKKLLEIRPGAVSSDDCPLALFLKLRVEAEEARLEKGHQDLIAARAAGGKTVSESIRRVLRKQAEKADTYIEFRTSEYIAERFIKEAQRQIAKDIGQSKVDIRWTKPKVVKGFPTFHGLNKDKGVDKWGRKKGLLVKPRKPWEWFPVKDLPKPLFESELKKTTEPLSWHQEVGGVSQLFVTPVNSPVRTTFKRTGEDLKVEQPATKSRRK